jgi:hypothetical protein
MRAPLTVFATILCAITPAAAQQRGQPTLVLTIYAGANTGHELWGVDRQTLIFGGNTSNPPDTARVTRQLSAAPMLGGLFQLFPRGGWLGFSADLGWRSLGLDDTCTPAAPFQPDTDGRSNQVLCDNVSALTHPGGSVVAIGLAGMVRLAPGATISPYLRAGGNLSFTTVSAIELAAPDTLFGIPRVVIDDNTPRHSSLGLLAAAGFTVRAGTAYQIRVEIRDDMSRIERVTGPANGLAAAPTEVALFHNLGLVLGLDVLLEQKRVRRY